MMVDLILDLPNSAAVLMNLDLVITVDTALAHLAGAMAVPTWVVLPAAPDWRWLLDRDDTPWYPSLRLFRQRRLLVWDDVFSRVKGELEQRLVMLQRSPAMLALPQLLDMAAKYHRAGCKHQARRVCQRILDIDPRHADALNLLALIARRD